MSFSHLKYNFKQMFRDSSSKSRETVQQQVTEEFKSKSTPSEDTLTKPDEHDEAEATV